MMMSANGDDSVCFPCLSKCEWPRPVFCSFILSYLFLWGLERYETLFCRAFSCCRVG